MLQLKFIKKDILKRVKFEPKPKPKKSKYLWFVLHTCDQAQLGNAFV